MKILLKRLSLAAEVSVFWDMAVRHWTIPAGRFGTIAFSGNVGHQLPCDAKPPFHNKGDLSRPTLFQKLERRT